MAKAKEWRNALQSGLAKVHAAGGDRPVTADEMIRLAPELGGLVADLGEALAAKSPLYTREHGVTHWKGTRPRKFYVRELER